MHMHNAKEAQMNRRIFLKLGTYLTIWLSFAPLTRTITKPSIAEAAPLPNTVNTYGSGAYGHGVYVGESPQEPTSLASPSDTKVFMPMLIGGGN